MPLSPTLVHPNRHPFRSWRPRLAGFFLAGAQTLPHQPVLRPPTAHTHAHCIHSPPAPTPCQPTCLPRSVSMNSSVLHYTTITSRTILLAC